MTTRHADDVTITDLVRLRRENEALQSQLKNALDAVTKLMRKNMELMRKNMNLMKPKGKK